MARSALLDLMSKSNVTPREDLLARWTEEDPEAEGAPPYGWFLDDRGLVVTSHRRVRAILTGADPKALHFEAGVEASWPTEHRAVFLDWGRQELSWEEVFELWDAWDAQGMIVDAGSVAVPWTPQPRWVSPGWIVFRGDVVGDPLNTVPRAEAGLSFLAKARKFRSEDPADVDAPLPMLPFTLADLKAGRGLGVA